MAATAAAMGAAAAAMRQKQREDEEQRNSNFSSKNSNNNLRPETKQEKEDRREMKNFEEEFMKMLTRTSLRRFAQSDGVPAADTQESILEACSTASSGNTAKLLSPAELLAEFAREDAENGEEEYDDDDEGDDDEDDENDDMKEVEDNNNQQKQSSSSSCESPSPRRKFNNFDPKNLGLDVESKYLTAEQRRLLRQEHDMRWLHAIPTRLKNWLQDHVVVTGNNGKNIKNKSGSTSSSFSLQSSSILGAPSGQKDLDMFAELVVRVPIVGAGRDEILAFCSQFGHCEYQGPCFSSSPASKKSKKNEDDHHSSTSAASSSATARNEIRNFCHIVKFTSGLDAIRCFVELNGYYIDPKQYEDEIGQAAVNAVKSTSKKLQKEHLSLDDKMRDSEFLSSALGDLDIKSGEKFGPPDEDDLARCWTSRFIFITCDFFRISFFNKAQLSEGKGEFIPRVEMMTRSPYEDLSSFKSSSSSSSNLSGIGGFISSLFGGGANENNNSDNKNSNNKKSNTSSSSNISSKIPSNWNPADIICKKLALRARELIGIFPLVTSHKDIEWQGMCRASNCISMFIPISTEENNTAESDGNKNNNNNVWIHTLRALRGCNVNIIILFRAIDTSSSLDELIDLSFKYSFEDYRRAGGKNATQRGIVQVDAGNNENQNSDDGGNDENEKNKKKKQQKVGGGFWRQFSFASFSSPDPSGRRSNRLIELSALVILVLLFLWCGVVFSGLLDQQKASVTHGQKVLEKRGRGGGGGGGNDELND